MAIQGDFFSEEELVALRKLAQQQIAITIATTEQNKPLRPTYNDVVANLSKQGITVGNQSFCWLRLRMHSYVMFRIGTLAMGQDKGLCIHCGHEKIFFYVGYDPTPG